MANDSLKNKFTGCLVGAAIGDALGAPFEDVPWNKCLTYYPGYPDNIKTFVRPHSNTPCRYLEAGQHTDDTQLLIALCESLIEEEQFSPGHFAKKLTEWYEECNEKRYRGEATKAGIRNLIKGQDWERSGVNKAGCGGSTRAVPIGLFFFRKPSDATKFGAQQCHITHNNQIAKDGAILVASTIGCLLRDEKISIATLQKLPKSREFKEKLAEVEDALDRGLEIPCAVDVLGNSSLATEAVGLSLFLFFSEPRDFNETVLDAAVKTTGKKGGDTDSIGFLVGAFSGARNGFDGIRKDWVEGVENGRRLQDLAKKIYVVACEPDMDQ